MKVKDFYEKYPDRELPPKEEAQPDKRIPGVDNSGSVDSRLQHAVHFIEGYRAFYVGGEQPFAIESARAFSWTCGYDVAESEAPSYLAD